MRTDRVAALRQRGYTTYEAAFGHVVRASADEAVGCGGSEVLGSAFGQYSDQSRGGGGVTEPEGNRLALRRCALAISHSVSNKTR
jgi:hypothetical protein